MSSRSGLGDGNGKGQELRARGTRSRSRSSSTGERTDTNNKSRMVDPRSLVSVATELESEGPMTSVVSKFSGSKARGSGRRPDAMLEGAGVGDYDMRKSASMAAFVQEVMEDKYLSRERDRLVAPSLGIVGEEEPERRVAGMVLGSATISMLEGVGAIRADDFWRCFEKERIRPWNWNAFLFPMWVLGVGIRYLILFPFRCVILALGWIVFGLGMVLVNAVMPRGRRKERALQRLISAMSSCFVLSWFGVIQYHGHPTTPSFGAGHPPTNVVFVSNHTSLIDVIVLQQVRCFSLVGQSHVGLVNFLQTKVLACLQCVWFDRAEMRDRAAVSRRLTEHAKDPTRNPLLVFPEGTCVNNRYVIQFKKGVFELGVPIVPVAIRYSKFCVDPFWSSRDQTFLDHLIELMTSWCMIADVHFLDPTTRRDGESAEEFARRVRDTIAEAAGLETREWDGYWKALYRPNQRLIEQRKTVYADAFHRVLEEVNEADRRRREREGVFEDGENESQGSDFFVGSPTPPPPAVAPTWVGGMRQNPLDGGGGSSLGRPKSNTNEDETFVEESFAGTTGSPLNSRRPRVGSLPTNIVLPMGPAALSSHRTLPWAGGGKLPPPAVRPTPLVVASSVPLRAGSGGNQGANGGKS